jgi:hypothetical protein
MSTSRKALVLHLAGNPSPVLIEVTAETAADLGSRLSQVVRNGHTQTLTGVNGTEFAVNFSHVVTAHFEDVERNATLYGSNRKEFGE